ncbi:MAG: DNA polymerase I [Bacteroidales bacterium]|nr:DNA polymerase I [Bacteroidales bacterium]
MKKIFFLDAYALIFRAYYAFIKNPRINSKGVNTSAIFGFFNTFLDVIQKENPTHLAVAFDSSAKTFRHDLFAAYKATREATPEDIRQSIPYIKQILEALEVPLFEIPGFEADDVIGTLAKKYAEKGFTVFMMTSDKDYCQLVDHNIFIYKPSRSGNDVEILGIPEVLKVFEVHHPKQVIDVLGLWGDSSDNIPGAPGIGEKTAKKLIKEYGSIENLIAQADKLQGKIKETIINHKDQILLSKKLVTIFTDVPLNIREQDIELNKPDINKIIPIFEELEFKTLLRRFYEWSKGINLPNSKTNQLETSPTLFDQVLIAENLISKHKTIHDTAHHYELIKSEKDVEKLAQSLLQCKEFSFDTETNSLDTIKPEIVGISFCHEPNHAFYITLPVNRQDTERWLSYLKPVFENENILKIAQNLKFDYQVLTHYGINIKPPIFDTMVAHYILEPEQSHNLDFLAKAFLNYSPISFEQLTGEKKTKQYNLRLLDINKLKDYCCEDSDIAFQLKQVLAPLLVEKNLWKLFELVEMPLVQVLADMELYGISIEETVLHSLSQVLIQQLQTIEQEIYQLSGAIFNINSPRQLGEILFEKLSIDANAKKTKTKQYATGEEELLKYIDKHPIISKILEYRTLQKLLNTYTEALPKLIHPTSKKLHTSFSQVTTATGRLSSQNPNLQNIPIREELGREIRKAFVPSEKYQYIISADYSQIELRIMAHLSNDENMINDFSHNMDIHAATASRIFNVSIEEVTKDMRRKAKIANFGIIYGISAFGLSQRLGIGRSEAKQLIDQYFSKYPKIQEYMQQQIAFAREHGFVETILKRRRYLPDINSRNATVRSFAERNAINAPIQGSAADIIKLAMVDIHKELKQRHLKTRMLLQVHDELVFETTNEELHEATTIIKNKMENVYSLKVPLSVEIGYGKNWFEAH